MHLFYLLYFAITILQAIITVIISTLLYFRCRRWVINCRRADLDDKSSSSLHSGGYVLCEKHFQPSLIRKNDKRTRLLKDAYPTLFDIPNPVQRLKSSRPPKKRVRVENAQKDNDPSFPTPSCSSVPPGNVHTL